VDTAGRVHVTFYDDRDYRDGGAQDEDQTDQTSYPKFDVYYTIVTFDENGDPSFDEYELEAASASEPALDFTLEGFPPQGIYRPGEYMGMTLRDVAGSDPEIWAAFASTSRSDSSDDPTVISYSRIILDGN
jgi:hypothetical protein